MSLRLAIVGALLLVTLVNRGSAQRVGAERAVTDSEIQLVIGAIHDEIYANGYQAKYLDMPEDSVPLYVEPRRQRGLIWIVYKLMPFGELRRAAFESPDGKLMILAGDPENGFPPTRETAMPTVYLRDDDVIQMKTTWKRTWFSIRVRPSSDEIREARERQARRKGIHLP